MMVALYTIGETVKEVAYKGKLLPNMIGAISLILILASLIIVTFVLLWGFADILKKVSLDEKKVLDLYLLVYGLEILAMLLSGLTINHQSITLRNTFNTLIPFSVVFIFVATILVPGIWIFINFLRE